MEGRGEEGRERSRMINETNASLSLLRSRIGEEGGGRGSLSGEKLDLPRGNGQWRTGGRANLVDS